MDLAGVHEYQYYASWVQFSMLHTVNRRAHFLHVLMWYVAKWLPRQTNRI